MNQDGLVDVLVSPCVDGPSRLFLNSGDGVPFESTGLGIQGLTETFGLRRAEFVAADIDGDDDVDFLNADLDLFLNNGFTGIPMPVITVSPDQNVAEDAGSVDLTLRLNQPQTDLITLEFGTTSSSFSSPASRATPGEDFYGVFDALSFLPGETDKSVRVTILSDDVAEEDETFQGRFSYANGANLDRDTVKVTIKDERTPRAFISTTPVDVVEGATVPMRISLNQSWGRPYSVRLASRSLQATSGIDYYGISTLVTFEPGETTKSVDLITLKDNVNEDNERLLVRLVAPSEGLSITNNDNRYITILDSSAQGELKISTDSPELIEGRISIATVALSRPETEDVSVRWATRPITAVPGRDFYGNSGVVTIPAGDTTASLRIQTLDNTVEDLQARTFEMRIYSPTGAVIRSGQSNTGPIEILDDD